MYSYETSYKYKSEERVECKSSVEEVATTLYTYICNCVDYLNCATTIVAPEAIAWFIEVVWGHNKL